jgi:3-oxoacyl-[acyl-carrier protein] reductase
MPPFASVDHDTSTPPARIMPDRTGVVQIFSSERTVVRAPGIRPATPATRATWWNASVLDMTDEQWLRVLDVTLTGTFRCTRAALRRMVAQGHGGAVVNNASVLGWRAQPGQAHYAAAKAGVMAFTRCAALDVARHGIRVNAVAPSLAIHPFLAKVSGEDLLADLTRRESFGRAAEPWEVANVMVFLASDYAGYMTGEVVSVSAQHP